MGIGRCHNWDEDSEGGTNHPLGCQCQGCISARAMLPYTGEYDTLEEELHETQNELKELHKEFNELRSMVVQRKDLIMNEKEIKKLADEIANAPSHFDTMAPLEDVQMESAEDIKEKMSNILDKQKE